MGEVEGEMTNWRTRLKDKHSTWTMVKLDLKNHPQLANWLKEQAGLTGSSVPDVIREILEDERQNSGPPKTT